MEDILDLYAEEYDPRYPTICFDEHPYQMVAETRVPLPAENGLPERYDYEYRRNGTCNLFIFFQPQAGWRHVKVTQQRTKQDFAHCMKDLVDTHFSTAEKIRVVQDNLNTHTPASLYETFDPEEARRIVRKLEFRYTPKHGSWLNMAEIEISVLQGQCLDRRLANIETVSSEVTAWEQARNAIRAAVDWQFTTSKARTKLQRLYPSNS
jgi:hypothetical protein